jgi:hypothetical protein
MKGKTGHTLPNSAVTQQRNVTSVYGVTVSFALGRFSARSIRTHVGFQRALKDVTLHH